VAVVHAVVSGIGVQHRTEIQIVLLVIGMIVWGYGQRSESQVLQYAGLGFFVVAAAMRLFKKKEEEKPDDTE
jgi:hypothetical protein